MDDDTSAQKDDIIIFAPFKFSAVVQFKVETVVNLVVAQLDVVFINGVPKGVIWSIALVRYVDSSYSHGE